MNPLNWEMKMAINRRHFLGAACSAALASLLEYKHGLALSGEQRIPDSPINVILPKNYSPPTSETTRDYTKKLTRATLDYLESSYGTRNLPIWNRPLSEIDLERRLHVITYWIDQAIQQYRSIYPVDPSWVLAQIMHESFFYEFAVSRALAVGICQFIQPTAKEYEMLCAGDLEEHTREPYLKGELAGKLAEYYDLRRKKRTFNRRFKPNKNMQLDIVLERLLNDDIEALKQEAETWLNVQKIKQEYDDRIAAARVQYTEFLEANLEGRDIFNEEDLQFLQKFDERVTHRKPIFAMVKMLARSLRARNGNILAAAAGYNAGLSTTRARGVYKPFGKIPNFEETVTYISRVLINHFEIVRRLA